MYRNAADVLRARYFALAGEAEQQRLELSPGELGRLPTDLRSRLNAVASRFLPEALTPAAMQDAERALEEHRRLLAYAHEVMVSLREAERQRRRRRRVKAWWLLPLAVVGGPIGVTLCTLPDDLGVRGEPATRTAERSKRGRGCGMVRLGASRQVWIAEGRNTPWGVWDELDADGGGATFAACP